MKILWLVNIIMPDFAKALGLNADNTGGWLTGQLSALSQENGISITVCTTSSKISEIKKACVNNINYIAVPTCENLQIAFTEILKSEKPDAIHIFGTEQKHSLAMAKAASYESCLVTIQGAVSECLQHYFDGLPSKYKKKNILKAAGEKLLNKVGLYPAILSVSYEKFCECSKSELEILRNAKYFSGRTHWDKAIVEKSNPNAVYFHLNENLREPFYCGGTWSRESCVPHTIFVSQATYPIKGFHMLLKAAKDVKNAYPDFHIYVGGQQPVTSKNIIARLGISWFFEYQTYVQRLIKKYGLEQSVTFLGALNAQQMKEQYLKANAFVSPSAIENSPNSVGEAMILGTPVVSSDVGGVATMLKDGEEGLLYDFYDIRALSNAICMVFEDKALTDRLSKSAQNKALITHNKSLNTSQLLNIYNEIIKKL